MNESFPNSMAKRDKKQDIIVKVYSWYYKFTIQARYRLNEDDEYHLL